MNPPADLQPAGISPQNLASGLIIVRPQLDDMPPQQSVFLVLFGKMSRGAIALIIDLQLICFIR